MTIGERIPDLSDQELENLHANAVRLRETGSAIQRQQAEELLPLVGAALDERNAARVAAQTQMRRTSAQARKAKR